MEAVMFISCLFVLAMSALCFFGQIFIGHLIPTTTAMGIFGLIAGISGMSVAAGSSKHRKAATIGGFGGVLSVAADVANYYLNLAIPGNYYAWPVFGAYAAALAIIGIAALRKPDDKPV